MRILPGQALSFCQKGRRENQEDSRYPDSDRPLAPHAYIVCDGVGGLEGGEVASRAVTCAMGEHMEGINLETEFTSDDFATALHHAYNALDRAGARGAATTLAFLCFHSGGAMAAHIGDSRIYHIRPGSGILYRSNDHSLVNSLVRSGTITPQEAAHHPKSNYITRCMKGGGSRACATVWESIDVEPGDYFLLCTDGVLSRVDEGMLLSLLEGEGDDETKMATIALLCQDSQDNNTAILVPISTVLHDWAEVEADDVSPRTAALCTETEVVAEVEPSRESFGQRLRAFAGKIGL